MPIYINFASERMCMCINEMETLLQLIKELVADMMTPVQNNVTDDRKAMVGCNLQKMTEWSRENKRKQVKD